MNFINLKSIYSHLRDEESEYLFDLRLQYALDGNSTGFMKSIYHMDKKWDISPRDDISPFCHEGKIIIFGAGISGIFTKKL